MLPPAPANSSQLNMISFRHKCSREMKEYYLENTILLEGKLENCSDGEVKDVSVIHYIDISVMQHFTRLCAFHWGFGLLL